MPQIEVGDIVRISKGAFCDTVVTKVEETNGQCMITLARPYAYASPYSRFPLLSFEIMEYLPESTVLSWGTLDKGRVR